MWPNVSQDIIEDIIGTIDEPPPLPQWFEKTAVTYNHIHATSGVIDACRRTRHHVSVDFLHKVQEGVCLNNAFRALPRGGAIFDISSRSPFDGPGSRRDAYIWNGYDISAPCG